MTCAPLSPHSCTERLAQSARISRRDDHRRRRGSSPGHQAGLTSAQTRSKGLDRRDQADERGDDEGTLESDGITISLGAPGFTQYLRRPPVHCPGQALAVEERGGFSFDRRGYTP